MQPRARPHTQEQKIKEVDRQIKKTKEKKYLSPKNTKAASILINFNNKIASELIVKAKKASNNNAQKPKIKKKSMSIQKPQIKAKKTHNPSCEPKQQIPPHVEKKATNIPFSNNRFQGRYDEIVPVQFKEKNEQFGKEKNEKQAKSEEIKQKIEKIKAESLRIRRDNQLLAKKQLQDNYMDPTEKRKIEEREKEKEEAEKRRNEWRIKLENRHREMGLEVIHKLNVNTKPKQPQSIINYIDL